MVNAVLVHNNDNKKKPSFESFFFMGEEKPDEELMGKRKSSPRLSTTLVMSIITGWPESFLFIHLRQQFVNKISATKQTDYFSN
ncbi:hypothetical protein DC345_08220 [Paenibacillus taichungensis]|uniref:Uncharacterized protein n=1 Tax=Paenibacillus taichungensis TaxID=484184 RepID=A0A329QXA9_9BACL|nr:hypothetical protein DC345_08220 [Paenibacillus taichungensis]